MVSMGSLVLFTSFFLFICIHLTNARLLRIAEKNDENEMAGKTRVHAQPPMIPFMKGSDKFEASSSRQVALRKGKQMQGTLYTPFLIDHHVKEEVDHYGNDNIRLTDYSPPRTHPPTHKGK